MESFSGTKKTRLRMTASPQAGDWVFTGFEGRGFSVAESLGVAPPL